MNKVRKANRQAVRLLLLRSNVRGVSVDIVRREQTRGQDAASVTRNTASAAAHWKQWRHSPSRTGCTYRHGEHRQYSQQMENGRCGRSRRIWSKNNPRTALEQPFIAPSARRIPITIAASIPSKICPTRRGAFPPPAQNRDHCKAVHRTQRQEHEAPPQPVARACRCVAKSFSRQ